MLHVKFQDHRTNGSGEEDFLKVFIKVFTTSVTVGEVLRVKLV